jgi:ubiquinone/menaquinone biosynthesis C-methylase UbiE
VVSLMALSEGHVVADIGAGTGYFLPHLAGAVGKSGTVLGLDVEPDMVRYMGERAAKEGWDNVKARKAQPDDPSIEGGSVDRILIVNTWHHIPDRAAYARKLLLALKPGGAVFVVDYTMDSPHGPPRDHRLPADRVIDELSRGGFNASLSEEDLPYQYVVIGRKG